MITNSRPIVSYHHSAVMAASSMLRPVVLPVSAAGSRGHIREDEWFGRPSRDNALITHEPVI